MADAKFTKGPWSYAPVVPGAKGSFYVTGNHAAHNREVDIATVQGGAYSCEANAALIAAAPDLYEALKPFADMDFLIVGGGSEAVIAMCDRALAALNKAEGK